MNDKLKTAFDVIRAEESLKANTTLFLQKEILKRGEKKERAVLKKYAVAFASCLMLLLSGVFAYNVYFTPAAYVDVDVNPSIELTLNRFDRVIDARAYNDDGQYIISGVSIKHSGYDDALVALMEAMTEQGYFQDGGLVSVTLQTDDKSKETALLADIQTGVESYLSEHSQTASLDVFPVSGETRTHSHEAGVSPAKYIAIQELIEADPTASVESCRENTIGEIRRMTQEHGNHHGNNGNSSEIDDNGYLDDETDDSVGDTQGSNQPNQHNGGGHHGGGH